MRSPSLLKAICRRAQPPLAAVHLSAYTATGSLVLSRSAGLSRSAQDLLKKEIT